MIKIGKCLANCLKWQITDEYISLYDGAKRTLLRVEGVLAGTLFRVSKRGSSESAFCE